MNARPTPSFHLLPLRIHSLLFLTRLEHIHNANTSLTRTRITLQVSSLSVLNSPFPLSDDSEDDLGVGHTAPHLPRGPTYNTFTRTPHRHNAGRRDGRYHDLLLLHKL